jgi:hypothetical protein
LEEYRAMLPLPQARVAVVTLRLALNRLVRVAFAGLLPAPHRAEEPDRVTMYRPARDLLLGCDSAQELCAQNPIGVAAAAVPAELPA